jgi:HD-GYP domain-containing protein (c-di-GMP phosphodiesterase class II)
VTTMTDAGRASDEEGLSASSFAAVALHVDDAAPWSKGHSGRVARLAAAIAGGLGWDAADVEALREAAELHDVGKLCVAADVLGRRGPLAPSERADVELHPGLGAAMLATVLSPAQVAWVRHHHERWDGRGYPDRLEGDDIPPGACIIGVAEAWDAMTSPGATEPLDIVAARREIIRTKGHQFAPWAADGLLRSGPGAHTAIP